LQTLDTCFVEVLGRACNISPTTIITQLYLGIWCLEGVSLLLGQVHNPQQGS